MAGQPKRKAMREELARRARLWLELDDGAAISPAQVLDFAEDHIASGGTILSLVQQVNAATSLLLGEDVDISREALSAYLRGLGENAEERLSRARARGAHGLVEEAISISDGSVIDNVDASRQRLRVSARQWTAERWNRAELGNLAAPQVSISITNLHLASLQAAGPRMLTAEAHMIEPESVADALGALGL